MLVKLCTGTICFGCAQYETRRTQNLVRVCDEWGAFECKMCAIATMGLLGACLRLRENQNE
jgi:hypothetical protein